MAKFKRRNTAMVEANQFVKGSPPYPEGVVYNPILRQEPYVDGTYGRTFLRDGDWVATVEDGTTVVLSHVVFERLFEPAD